MSKDHIRYDLLVQNALKSVVRKVLADASRDGMPPDHHFYVSFHTNVSGVKISSRLRERYPEEMTIVLQHQFWDLTVNDALFEVGLSFSGIPERLTVPFDAISGFYDPSVEFGLKFEVKDDEADAAAGEAAGASASGKGAAGKSGLASVRIDDEPAPEPRQFTPRSVRERAAATASSNAEADSGDTGASDAATASDSSEPSAPAQVDDDKADAGTGKGADDPKNLLDNADVSAEQEAADDAPTSGAQVVSLDAFRKKH